jgi:NAD(P)-dependent dehydrogenase (short-subunit alcohol dehydrogenase family)
LINLEPTSSDLSGRVAFITGAGSGLGCRFAQILARAGAAVVLAGRRTDPLRNLADEIGRQGGHAFACSLDVCETGEIAKGIDAAEAAFGTVDLLVNNAGIPDANYATRLPVQMIDRVLDTNFRAPFLFSTEVARRLMALGKPGNIVNVASVSAYHYPHKAAAALYSATKSGIIRLTECLAAEWAEFGINVNAIAPGSFRSEMTEGYLTRVGERVVERYARKRLGEPPFLDSTLLFLTSPASHFVTGACIIVGDAQVGR